MAFKNLTDWARDTLKPSEIREMIEELQALLTSRNAEDDEPAGTPDREAFNRERSKAAEAALNQKLSGMDSRRGTSASDSFAKMYPDSGRIKTAF
jgi:hypothetical protein